MVGLTEHVELESAPGVWTDVSHSVIGVLTFRRGINGGRPSDRVSAVGTLRWSLRNDADSVGGIGQFSPGHANCPGWFRRGIRVRVRYHYQAVDYVRWTGTLVVIDPVPGQYRNEPTHCSAESTMARLLAKVREVDLQINVTDVEAAQTVLVALPPEAQPSSVQFDPALDTFKVALGDVGGGASAMTLLQRVCESSSSYYLERGDGSHRYQSRSRRALELSRFHFSDAHLGPSNGLSKPSSLADRVYNDVRIITHDSQFGASNTEVLFSYSGTLEIPAGETVELWLDYQDQSNRGFKIAGTAFQSFTASVDYAFNSAPDGGGSDLTGSIVTTGTTFFGTTAKVVLQNTSGSTAYSQILQGRGQAIRDLDPATSSAFVPADYGVRELTIDAKYLSSVVVARDQAAHFAASYHDLDDQVDAIEFIATRNEALLLQALSRELGEVVTVSEAKTATVQVAGYIQWIEYTVTGEDGPWIVCRFGLAPRIETEVPAQEDLSVGDDLVVSVAAPEHRIGYARIGLSEVA